MCEASTGFCHGIKIYTGQDKIDRNDSASENVVIELSQIYNKQGIYFVSEQVVLFTQPLFKITPEKDKRYRDST